MTTRGDLSPGHVELGEAVAEAAVREVREETGDDANPVGVVGVYSDPRSVVAYDDGEVRQQVAICLACRRAGGSVSADSDESLEVRFVGAERRREPDGETQLFAARA